MAYDKVVDSSVLDAGLKQIADAIREKGGTSDNLAFPTAMAEAIAAIEAWGGNIRIETGSVTFAEDQYGYRFLEEKPDVFILYSANEEKPIYSSVQGVVAMVRKLSGRRMWHFGYNKGSKKYYVPHYGVDNSSSFNPASFSNGEFNSCLAAIASPYVWYAIWGVE